MTAALHTTKEYEDWVAGIGARLAETNRRIRTSGGNHFWDMKTFKEMVTVLDGPPVPAWPLELRRRTHD